VNDAVVDRPESMELEHIFVPLGHRKHLIVGLIANDVVNEEQMGIWSFNSYKQKFIFK
jgi:hypothetical protein